MASNALLLVCAALNTASAATTGGSQGLTNAVVWVGYGVLAMGAAGTALSLARALVNAAPGAFGTAAAERMAAQRPDRGGGWGWEEGTAAHLTFDFSVDGGGMGGAASLLLGIGGGADAATAVQLPASVPSDRDPEARRGGVFSTPLLPPTPEPFDDGDDDVGMAPPTEDALHSVPSGNGDEGEIARGVRAELELFMARVAAGAIVPPSIATRRHTHTRAHKCPQPRKPFKHCCLFFLDKPSHF